MNRLFDEFKKIVLKDLNERIKDFNEENNDKLPLFTKTSVDFGAVDPLKKTEKSLISFYPESKEFEEEDIDGSLSVENKVTVSVVCRGEKYETLIQNICKYSYLIKDVFRENYTMNDECENIEFTSEKYYPDCGVTERTMTGVELEMTIYTEEN